MATLAEQGYRVTAGDPSWHGWPLAAVVDWPELRVQAEPDVFPPGLDWRVERLRLRVSPFRPTQVSMAAAGQQMVAAAGVAPIAMTASRFVGLIDLTGKRPARIEAADVDAASSAGSARAAAAVLVLLPSGWRVQVAKLAVAGIGLPLGYMEATITVDPPFPQSLDPVANATAWQRAGGAVHVTQTNLVWGPLRAQLSAEISLDATLQPVGTGTMAAAGLPQFVSALAASNAISGREAVAAQAVLTVFGGPNGAANSLTLPLALQRGTLSLAGFPLLRLAPLRLQ